MNGAQSACERLAQSRQRLYLALHQDAQPAPITRTGPFAKAANKLFNAMQSSTTTRLLATVLENWWRRHPVRLGWHVATQTAGMVVAPVVQKHPLALIAGSALVGALLVRTRAWRWLSVSALFAGLAPQLMKALASHQNP